MHRQPYLMSKRSTSDECPRPENPEAEAFREDMPDRPLKRFLVAFVVFTPIIWIGAVGYMHSTAARATVFAPVVAAVLGLIAMLGKRPLAWLLNFLHGGL